MRSGASTDRLRVMFFVAEFDRLNGGQRSLLQLVRRLPAFGVDPVVVFPGEGLCSRTFAGLGVQVEILPAPRSLVEFGQHLLAVSTARKLRVLLRDILPYSWRVTRLMRRLGCRVLHCNTTRSLLLSAPVAYLRRMPIVWHVRGQLEPFSVSVRRSSSRLATRIILVAESLGAEVPAEFRAKCRTIYNGIDETAFPRVSEEPPAGNGFPAEIGSPVIATFAAVTPFKGYHHLIRAAAAVTDRWEGPRPVFLGIGQPFDEEYRGYLDEALRRHGLDNFHFLGWQDDPLPYYRRADLVVLPTVHHEELRINGRLVRVRSGEGFPRTVLEAMYLGKPVVATAVAGAPEQVVEGETGYLVPPGDAEAMAQAILRVLRTSAGERRAMGARAAARARALFSTDRMTDETANLYREVTVR
jgi:glycosyltransferase involved in cell wall biosynthesis